MDAINEFTAGFGDLFNTLAEHPGGLIVLPLMAVPGLVAAAGQEKASFHRHAAASIAVISAGIMGMHLLATGGIDLPGDMINEMVGDSPAYNAGQATPHGLIAAASAYTAFRPK